MRPKTLILFFVAIGCGLVASIGVSQYMEKARSGGGAALETLKVYVASTEINIGEKLDDKNIKLEEWPKDRVPEGAVSELKELEHKYPRTRLYKGEPILAAKLSDTIDGNVPQQIPAGFRVVAVKVNAESAAGNLIRPGDHVDLVVFMRKSAEVPETTTKTILRDVTVFACDSETERAVDKGTGQARDTRTISVLVKPKQADLVTLAKELGVMSLTLRRPNDPSEESSEGENVQSLLGSDGENVNQRKRDSGDPSLADLLNQPVPQPPAPVPAPVPVVVAPVVPEEPAKFIMKIRTPNGDREYRWKDLDGEPEEAGTSGSATSAAYGPAFQPVPVTIAAPNSAPVEFRALPIRDDAPPRANGSLDDSTGTVNSNENETAEPATADGGPNAK